MQKQFAEQDQIEKLRRMDAAHKKEMEKLAQQEKDKLTKLDDAYEKQMNMIQTAFIDRLRVLDSTILGDTAAFNNYMKRQAQEFQQWLNNYKTSVTNSGSSFGGGNGGAVGVGVNSGKQYGGYAVFKGPGETGSEEFVMSGSSTKMAE